MINLNRVYAEDELVAAQIGETLLGELAGADFGVESARSFEEAGLLTANHGLVIRMVDGSEFQVTVVQSRSYLDGEGSR